MDIAIVVIELLIAIVWIQQGVVQYDFWKDGVPGGGFVPVVFATLILAVALAILIREIIGKKKTEKKSYRFKASSYLPAAAAVIGVFMIQVLGIAPAVFLFSTIWMHYISKYSWRKTLLSSTIFTVFIFGVFRLWLHVPFPHGLIYRLF